MRIICKLLDGTEKILNGKPQQNLLDLLVENDVPIFASCGGAGVCGTCMFSVDTNDFKKLPPPSINELNVLDAFSSKSNARLACEISITEACEGMTVTIEDL